MNAYASLDIDRVVVERLSSTVMLLDNHVALQGKLITFATPNLHVAGVRLLANAAVPVALINETQANAFFGVNTDYRYVEAVSNEIVKDWSYRKRLVLLPQHHEGWHIVNRLLNKWAGLKPDWDGEGGIVPSQAVIGHAKAFIGKIMHEGVIPPEPFIAGDGEIGFRWSQEGWSASVCFLDDGCIVAFCHSPTMKESYTLDEQAHEHQDLSTLVSSLRGFTYNDELDRKT